MTAVLPPKTLLALSTGALQGPRDFPPFLRRLRLALEAGLPGVLLREPQLSAAELFELAREVVELCASTTGAWCAVHDSVHVALATKAHGVHLGFRSLTPKIVRAMVGDSLSIGFSSHAAEDPNTWRGADYLFHGPVRETPSKQGLLDPVGLSGLEHFCDGCEPPVFGLGGIGPAEAAAVRASGAGVAVLSGVLAADDPAFAVREYLKAINRCEPGIQS